MSNNATEKAFRETPSEDSGEDSDEEQWADAQEDVSLPTSPQSKMASQRAEYPNGREPEEVLTDDQLRDLLAQANTCKTTGNELFRKADWEGAIGAYTDALKKLPSRPAKPPTPAKGKGKEEVTDNEVDEEDEDDDGEKSADESKDVPIEMTPLQKEIATTRAVLNSNLAACYVKLGKHEEVVKLCTEALLDDPTYTKALQRRASSNEQLNTWTSLSDAHKDYTTLLTLLPASSPQRSQITQSLRTLPSRIETAKKKETEEMVGKLKDLGNTVLGKFGLSTDNFQFTPNGQGGYSMNFVR